MKKRIQHLTAAEDITFASAQSRRLMSSRNFCFAWKRYFYIEQNTDRAQASAV